MTGGDCVVDMNGDHLDDVVSASSTNIRIQHQLAGGGFAPVNITTTPADNTPSWSIAAGDIDGNGFNDLLYGGGSGATFMMANDDGTAFTEVSFPQYIFSQRTNMVDINNDGNLDAFVCHDVDANVSFLNDGTGNLSFGQGGFGLTCGNYGSVWIDYDNDGLMDCFVAKCGCDPVDLLMHNNGDGTFTNVAGPLGFADNHQSWSSAWGDFDNDGDMDVLVGGSSSGYNKLISNNGDGTFTNVTPGSGFDLFNGQSIEWTTHDFNNDGYLDVLGGGAIMYGNGAMVFAQGPSYPGTGAVGDLNNDGFLDVMGWSAPMMNGGNDYNWLKVNTIGTVSNTNGIGARVMVTSNLGSQIRDVKSGDAFSTMSSLTTHFGLGADQVVEELRIQWPSGIVTVLNDVPANTTVNVVEELNTSLVEAPERTALRVYPNPTEDRLYFEMPTSSGTRQATVFDITGKRIMEPMPVLNNMDVSTLSSGMYLLRVQQDGQLFQTTFNRR
ncbi:MAG: FG-GAP-like repeat-containing protein [Flavobacteriales bacterium]